MANLVRVSQLGSVTKDVSASTVGDALSLFGVEGNYQVKLDGVAVSMETSIPLPKPNGELPFISIGDKVKGGLVK